MKKFLIALLCAVMLFKPVPVYAAENSDMIEISEEWFAQAIIFYFSQAQKMSDTQEDWNALVTYDKEDNLVHVLLMFSGKYSSFTESDAKEAADIFYEKYFTELMKYSGGVVVSVQSKKVNKDFTYKGGKSTKASTDKSSKSATTNKSSATKSTGTSSTGKEQALKKAETLVKYGAYSKEKLRESLVKYSKFSEEEADYALENIKIDYKEQAVKKAETLLRYGSYSRDKLKESLVKYNNFTEEEAEHALKKVYDE